MLRLPTLCALTALSLVPLPPARPAAQEAARLERTGSPVALDEELVRLQRAAVVSYADYAHDIYRTCDALAEALLKAVRAFVAEPSAERLEEARAAWLAGRREFGKTEVLRFYNGPIDNPDTGVETFLNAWPLDEAYIDAVAGGEGGGIVGDPERFPNLSGTVLQLLNERGGEANVSIGWHAVEFLLWGQDTSDDSPGARPWTDFVSGEAPHAVRRGEYLLVCTELLVQHHAMLTAAWAPGVDDNYRAAFLAAEPGESFRKVLAGMTILTGFEMSGERLAVAYETQDQEEEHSCFSDNTHVDFIADQEGILAVWRGGEEPGRVGVADVAKHADPQLAAQLERELEASLAALTAMPVPFDQAIRGADEEPQRRAVLKALVALEDQARTLATLGLVLGYDIALQPGG